MESYNYNDRIKITVNSSSFTELYNSYIYFRLKIKTVPKSATQNKLGFVQNGLMHLFSDAILEINGTILQQTKNPGMCFYLFDMLTQDSDDLTSSSEFAYSSFSGKENNTFDFTIPLKNFFTFARDYKKFMIYSRFDFTFVRARNDYNAVVCDKAVTVPTTADGVPEIAELEISKFQLRIPHVAVNDVLKLKILKSLDSGKEISLPFRSTKYHEFTNIPIATEFEWMIKSSVKRPLYAIATFQVDKYYNLNTNNSKFDHSKVRSIRLNVNSSAYPFEQLNLNFSDNYFAEAYKMYLEMKKNALDNKKGAVMTKADFANDYPIFCFDLSNYDFEIKDSVVDLKLSCEFHENPAANTNVILVLIYENLFSYNAITNIVNKEI